jgi:hypothetical protein
VVGGVQIARDLDQRNALLEGVLGGSLREPRVLKDSERDLLHIGAVVCGVDRRHAVGIGGSDERIPQTQHHQAAARARGSAVLAVIGFSRRVLRPTGTVVLRGSIARGVGWVVVVVEEIPARDIVDVGVPIRVDAIGESADDVLPVEPGGNAVRTAIGVDARIVGVVVDVEGAVAVRIVRGRRRAVGQTGQRQLSAVQPDL